MRKFLVVFIVVFLASPVWAKNIAGVAIDEMVTNADGVELKLNGAGIRKKVFFKIYIAELYLQNPQKEAQRAISDPGAKRVIMHFLYDEVGKDKIVDAWNEGFAANVEAETLKALQAQIDTFNAMFVEDMVEGDVILFDYIPGKGTRVEIKGNDKGVIEGKQFNDALLSIWLGKEPVSSDLRSEMLGQ